MEAKAKASFRTDNSCIGCGLCVNKCPMYNLELVNGKLNKMELYSLLSMCKYMSETKLYSLLYKETKEAIQRNFIDPK